MALLPISKTLFIRVWSFDAIAKACNSEAYLTDKGENRPIVEFFVLRAKRDVASKQKEASAIEQRSGLSSAEQKQNEDGSSLGFPALEPDDNDISSSSRVYEHPDEAPEDQDEFYEGSNGHDTIKMRVDDREFLFELVLRLSSCEFKRLCSAQVFFDDLESWIMKTFNTSFKGASAAGEELNNICTAQQKSAAAAKRLTDDQQSWHLSSHDGTFPSKIFLTPKRQNTQNK